MYLKKKTLKELFELAVKEYATRPALAYYDSEPITYKELGERVRALSSFLKEKGVKKGDKVAIIGENSPNWGIAYLSIVTMGAVVVPILPDFHAEDIAHIISHSESKIVFVTQRQMDKLLEVEVKGVELVISLDDFVPEFSFAKTEPISKLIGKASEILKTIPEKVGLLSSEIKEEDLSSIIYTSGTTGHSKGVMLTHKNIVSNIQQIDDYFDLTPGDRLLSILPLSHAYECTLAFLYPLSVGCCIYYLGKKPTPKLLLEAASKVKPTVMAAVPLIMEKIYKKHVLPVLRRNLMIKLLSSTPFVRRALYRKIGKKLVKLFGGELRTLAFGGASLNRELEIFLKEANFPYAVGYGLTETSPVLTGMRDEELRIGSCGRPLKDVEVKIVNPDPETGVGEIWVRGPNVMKGYYKNKELTREVLTEDGWLKTGDLGYLDKDNYLYIKGRSKSLILGPSGENIYPEAIEEKINMHPYVSESLVVERNGGLVALIYLEYSMLEDKLENKSEEDRERIIKEILEKIRGDVNEKLPSYAKLKECIEHPEPFEKTPTHKIKRYLYQ